jgi:TetR/AcrR family transcriptional regulator, regulator of autoinduction and epiphytic fitness
MRREYRSPRREAQARSTRSAILDAAEEAFLASGYTGATIAAIAEAAQVGQATVYAAFANKRSLLEAVMDRRIVGDDEPTPLDDRAEVQATLDDPDLTSRISRHSALHRAVLDRQRPILEIMTAVDPEVAALNQVYDDRRRESVRYHQQAMADAGLLPTGVDRHELEDITAAVLSPELYLKLVRDCGWTSDRYQAWLTRLLIAVSEPAG